MVVAGTQAAGTQAAAAPVAAAMVEVGTTRAYLLRGCAGLKMAIQSLRLRLHASLRQRDSACARL